MEQNKEIMAITPRVQQNSETILREVESRTAEIELTSATFMKMSNGRTAVIYIPNHAYDDVTHPDCEYGIISSYNDKYIFVKFNNAVKRLGWEGTTSQSCKPENLVFA